MGEDKVKDYLHLVGSIIALDVGAATYMTMVAPLDANIGFGFSSELDGVFVWEDTPQGYEYWDNLYTQLNGISLGEEYND